MSIPRRIHRHEPKLVPIRQLLHMFELLTLQDQCPPCVSRGNLFVEYIHSHMNLHMCAKFGANRPSRLVAFPEFVLRFVRLFAAVRADSSKNTPKNNTYTVYIENYNFGPNMQTSTSLTFLTAISVAFSGTLAEELMIFCRHVRTYNNTSLLPGFARDHCSIIISISAFYF